MQHWVSLGDLVRHLFDDQITINDIIVYALLSGTIIGIIATRIEYFSGRVRADLPRAQRYRLW